MPQGRAARPGQGGKPQPQRPEPKKAKGPTLLYILDAPATLAQNQVVITLARRMPKKTAAERAMKGKKRRWQPREPWRLEPEDRILLALLDEARTDFNPAEADGALRGAAAPGGAPIPRRYVLRHDAQANLLERLCRTGRCRLRRTEDEMNPPALRWDDGRPWRFVIDARLDDAQVKRWIWRGMLRRGDERMDLAEPLVLLPGLVIQGIGKAARFDDSGVFLWMTRLRHEKEMMVTEPQQDSMLGRIMAEARVPIGELVEGLPIEEVELPPTPSLTVRAPMQTRGVDALIADLEFDYDGARVPSFPPGKVAVQTARRRAIRRDVRLETRAKERLDELGFREIKDYRFDPGTMEVAPKRVPQAVRELVADGWRVQSEGVLYRPASDFKLAVTSGMDWFELDGKVAFGGTDVPLPQILEAARRGDTMIALGDGSIGMLPDAWLRKYGLLADLGTPGEDGALRFSKAQAGLLDAMLAAQPGSTADPSFQNVRDELHAFEGVQELDAPAGFQGELRPYQREGLGWLEYLRKFGFGGILADDMGLGKTVQVLALLQRRRSRRQSKGPSLIVVPRSLVFNWLQESAKFTPRLRVLDYTGPNRHPLREEFRNYDLIVTTYGTMRSDIAELNKVEFDYAILDEAQAIKNSESQSAKAARLLKARHRLAMSGTPIENHLGELWSIFEFLNPGMLGSAGVFKRASAGSSGQDEEARRLLAKALRPFILRRTKQQVVKDLPEKIEQTLYCDMEPAQRELYEQLKAHYRTALLRKDSDELRTSKIEVLEALLRLRQASCHPGLIDKGRLAEPSAKLDMLLYQMEEVVDEGHKILVFSQFTSFLSIVRDRLDAAKIPYEYLDGRTRNREERVERFQNDPKIPVFLISLKAGGLGLNLTAAEYVYLLDPWWNPAVEAQAIDRSHRIGQTKNVFAYRLIARDTVEQKILDLQQKKRDLADAILNADNRLIQALTRDDLEFLLS
jgi:superfamily II DNA or RNA helicase